jgi:hypothetical protein
MFLPTNHENEVTVFEPFRDIFREINLLNADAITGLIVIALGIICIVFSMAKTVKGNLYYLIVGTVGIWYGFLLQIPDWPHRFIVLGAFAVPFFMAVATIILVDAFHFRRPRKPDGS